MNTITHQAHRAMKTKQTKDLAYYESNAKDDYVDTPISVLRYIVELEELVHGPCMGSFDENGDTC